MIFFFFCVRGLRKLTLKRVICSNNKILPYLRQVKISLLPMPPKCDRFFRLGWHYWIPIHKQLDEAAEKDYEVEYPQEQRWSYPMPNPRLWTCQYCIMNQNTKHRTQVLVLFIMVNIFKQKCKKNGLETSWLLY
jgi:hypothetical protein